LPATHSHTYKRHRPEQTLLYQLVERHYPEFLEQLSRQGKSLPRHVEKEFEEFLKCGRLEHGFLRVVCDDCKHEKLVAFSCKRRGFYSGHPVLRPSGQPWLFKIVPDDFVPKLRGKTDGRKCQIVR